MSTKHIEFQLKLRVPVDELEILDGPSRRVIESAIGLYPESADYVKVRFKVRTPASSVPFSISGTICVACDRRDSQAFEYEYDFWFYTKERELLFGEYNPSSPRVGKLTADYHNPWDLSDPRNGD